MRTSPEPQGPLRLGQPQHVHYPSHALFVIQRLVASVSLKGIGKHMDPGDGQNKKASTNRKVLVYCKTEHLHDLCLKGTPCPV
jgi:hypothetical protein